MKLPTFTCGRCGKKALLTYDEYVVSGEDGSLCSKCVDRCINLEYLPGFMDAEHHLTFYSTWEDLERKLREDKPFMAGHRIGCSNVTERSAMLIEVFKSGKRVEWWVLSTAYNIPEKPPYPHWKEIVRELGGRV